MVLSRSRLFTMYAVIAVALAVLFGVFIAFRDDRALIGALEAAGTVAAAAFAAIAAVGSMRAAAESSAAARRTQEAAARAAQPSVTVSVTATDAVVTCRGRAATDVMSVFVFDGHETVTAQAARLEPGETLTADLPAEGLQPTMVWVDYRDGEYVGHWRDSWTPSDTGRLLRTESSLAG
jgi:hypothetical protein